MTTFSEREHSLENHYAHLTLLAFRERARRHRELAYRLAKTVGMDERDVELFATTVAEHCAIGPDDRVPYAYAAAELARRGYAISLAEIRRLAAGRAHATVETAVPRSWFEFLADQVVSLFNGRSGTGFGQAAPTGAYQRS